MARYDSFIKFKGSMGGLTFYQDAQGEWIAKQKNKKYQPTSEGTLRNNTELGGASTLCKHFRHSFYTVAKQFGGQDTCGRLNGKFKSVIALGTGDWGKRSFDLKAHPDPFVGFQFQKQWSVQQALSEPLLDLEMNATRDLVRWQLPNFVPRATVTAPLNATHFRLVLVGTQVSQGKYSEIVGGYEQVMPVSSDSGGVRFSEVFPLDTSAIDAFTLTVVPGSYLPTPDEMAVVVCAGVLFSQEVNGTLVELKDGRALDVLRVG